MKLGMYPDVVVLFALPREAHGFLKAFPVNEDIAVAPCRARICRRSGVSLLTMQTGVGSERMNKALDWILGRPLVGTAPYIPRIVISAGFSGGLCDRLRVGDIVMATEVVTSREECHMASWSELGAAAHACQHRRGRLLTVDRLIADPAEKRALALRHNALAVDMETAIIGRRCVEMGIPFACIRAISDDAHAPLAPELDYIIDNGRVSLRRLAVSVIRRPTLARDLWRLARNTRIAAERLGAALHDLLKGANRSPGTQ